MKLNALLRWLNLTPTFDGVDAGSGGGAAGAGAGASGLPGAGAAAAAGGVGAAAPIVLRDDTLVDFGDGKPIAWRDATGDRGRYVSRDRFDRGVAYLEQQAAEIDRRAQAAMRGQQTPQTPQRPTDPMEGLRDRPLIDGNNLGQLVDNLYRQGFAPLAQSLAAVMADNKAMKEQLQGVVQHTGSLNEERANANFESDITKTITGLGEIKGLGTLDPQNPAVRELARDIYLSYDQNSWKPGDFPAMLKSRVEAMFTYFRAAQQAEVKRAGEAKRAAFFNPQRGAAAGQGEPAYQHRKGAELAAALFQ